MAKRPKPPRERILDSALALAAERRWRDLGLRDIADAAGVSLAALHEHFSSKTAIVAAIMRQTDAAVAAGGDKTALKEPAHDRVLDALLRRLDVLSPHKTAIGSILRDLPCDPVNMMCLVPGFRNSMAWTLESAGIGTGGVAGRIRIEGVAAIYLASLRVWLRDDSADQARTMAFLDRRLRQAERFAALLPFGVVERPSRESAAA